jgi:hypothetical protein
MDFDHRDSETKTGNVSNMVKRYNAGLARLLDEIAKCDVVCSNCHRLRTHARLAEATSSRAQDREALR